SAVTLRADVLSSDIEVVGGAGNKVKAQLIDSSGAIRLAQSGDRVEVVLSTKSGWPHVPAGIDGKLRIEVPTGSHVELTSASGDIQVRDTGGNVRLRTVSGDAQVWQSSNGARFEYGTTSGDLDWSGSCRSGCRIEARSTSGDVKLRMMPDASFDLRYVTHSGDASDDLKMQTLEQSENRRGGGSLHARYGKGEGLVEVQTFSGDLHVARK
ncbi:MAG: DUF4097 family beta strand repeat-containing protein, partial [Polyangia bacterium]